MNHMVDQIRALQTRITHLENALGWKAEAPTWAIEEILTRHDHIGGIHGIRWYAHHPQTNTHASAPTENEAAQKLITYLTSNEWWRDENGWHQKKTI